MIGSQGFTLGWYAVTRWGTQNVTDSNTNSAAPSRCRASSSSERWRDAGVCGCTAGMDRGTRSLLGNVGVVASSGLLDTRRVWKIGVREAKPSFSGCFTGFNDRLDPNFTALYSVFHG